MDGSAKKSLRRRVRLSTTGLATAALIAAVPASAHAAVTTFDSPLAAPPTLNTTENLGYAGTFTPAIPSPQVPTGLLHTYHYGADTAMWNTTVANGQASAPATGQAVKVSVEGCAQPAPGGPAPLTQVHFQSLSPLPGGGVRVDLTSQPFDLPVCGENGANSSTVSTYEPINLCVAKGGYVALNDEGGWVPYIYQSGVPYQVIGSVPGSTMDSFLRGNGTNDGARLLFSDRTAMDGFSENPGEELAMQVTLGTGPDATHICPGGIGGLGPALPDLHIRPQTDGVNRSQSASVAIYCRPAGGCRGTATLEPAGAPAGVAKRSYGHANFSLPGGRTGHLKIRISSQLVKLLRKGHEVPVVLTAVMGGVTFTETIALRIY
jgi:hypothetical protein